MQPWSPNKLARHIEVDRPDMAKKFPLHPKHPERICWGCDKYCSVDALACGNGANRTQHPIEVLGDDWYMHGDWGLGLGVPQQADDNQGQ